MCGIVGFSYKNEVDLKKSLQKIAHRGPDNSGCYFDENVSFGHNRLSIIDLSDFANQPMISKDGGSVIIFNGEIYNFKDLKMDLERSGVKFKTNSDTEVILRGYEKEGIGFFSKMRGMWAFAIYDKKDKKIILSRDLFGIKPLYYSIDSNNHFFFSSEIKGIKNLLKLSPNKEFYYQYFNFGFFVAPNTCYKEVKKVEPGEVLVWDLIGKKLKSQKIDLIGNYSKNLVNNFEDTIDVLNQSILDSVRSHFVSDVPVGILFSGGNDSSLIAATASKIGKKPTLYHLDIKGSTDSYYADKIANHLGLELKSYEMNNQVLSDQYDKIWSILDEPTSDISVIPTSLIYSTINKDTKVVLSGEGGDEYFGGYLRHKNLIGLDGIKKDNGILELFNFLGSGQSFFSLEVLNPIINRLRNVSLNNFQNDLIGSYMKEIKNIDYPIFYNDTRSFLFEFFNKKTDKFVPNNLFFDLFLYLPSNLMYKNDISSMASSIEARTPFLDKNFYNNVFSKIRPEFLLSKKYNNKILIKKVLERYLPKELVYRDKKGFGFSFDIYGNKKIINDSIEALNFHQKNADIFGLNEGFIDSKNAELFLKKFPRFVFSLISNWKITQK